MDLVSKKIWFIILTLTIIILLLEFQLLHFEQKGSGPVAQLSGQTYQDTSAVHRIISGNRKILIVYFSLNCEHCRYQLGVFNDHISEFKDFDLYFLTAEKGLFESSFITGFRKLRQCKTAHFGVIDPGQYIKEYGKLRVPSIFVYNKSGVLENSIYGEIKIEKLIEILNNDVRPASG